MSRHSLRARVAFALVVGSMLLGAVASPASAVVHARWVDNDNHNGDGPRGCDHANFSSIQDAIDASSPGDKVYVCPGNYQEEITIDVPRLEVRSVPALGAKLWAPETMTDLGEGLTVEVHITARDVMFVGFWLKFNAGDIGPFVQTPVTTDCQQTVAAIWAEAPHATIKSNHIKTVGDNTLSGGCGYLFGIVLADYGDISTGGEWGPDTSLVWRNWVKDFKVGGILTGGDRAVKVWNNNVRYVHYNDVATCNFVPVLGIKNPSLEGDPTAEFPCEIPVAAQNTSPLDGIFPYSVGIADEGALVDLRGNTVYSTLDTAVPETQYSFLWGGIMLMSATDGSKVRSNIVDNVWMGLVVTEDEFFFPLAQPLPEAPDGVAVTGNRVSEGFFSLLVDGQDGYYYANRAHLNFLGAIATASSSGNTFERNDFRYNLEIDCADESTGTEAYLLANDWGDPTTNLGFQAEPEEICVPYFAIVFP